MKITKKFLIVAVAFAALALVACNKDEAKTTTATTSSAPVLSGSVSTNGSTSMASVISTLSESFMGKYPKISVTYDPTGSGSGIQSVTSGTSDIGLSSRALKQSEIDSGLQATVLALDGIAIVVNEHCKLENITLGDLAKIFTGEITNWSKVGGDNMEIACIGREAGSGTRDGFESITKTGGKCVLQSELTSTGAVISSVANNKNAVGYASLSAVAGQKGIKCLKVDDVYPTEGTVKDGSYKIQRPFVLVTKKDTKLSPVAQKFFDYITSSEVNSLIQKAGAIPVK